MLTVIGQIDHAYLLVESSTEGEDHNVTSIAILRKIINTQWNRSRSRDSLQ